MARTHAPIALAVLSALSGCNCGIGEDITLVGSCSAVWNDGLVRLSVRETPPDLLEAQGGLLERDLLVTRQAQESSGGRTTAVLSYQSAWVLGDLGIELMDPWGVRDSTGSTLRWSHFREATRCASGGATALTEDVLRDSANRLELLAVSMPLGSEGKVPLVAQLAPEIELEWRDLGCSPHQDSAGLQAVTVGLVGHADGKLWAAGLGQQTRFSLGGRDYLVSVVRAERRQDQDCGTLELAIFQDGFVWRPHDTASSRPDGGT